MKLQAKHDANEHLHKAKKKKTKKEGCLWEENARFSKSVCLYWHPAHSLIMNIKHGMEHGAGNALWQRGSLICGPIGPTLTSAL